MLSDFQVPSEGRRNEFEWQMAAGPRKVSSDCRVDEIIYENKQRKCRSYPGYTRRGKSIMVCVANARLSVKYEKDELPSFSYFNHRAEGTSGAPIILTEKFNWNQGKRFLRLDFYLQLEVPSIITYARACETTKQSNKLDGFAKIFAGWNKACGVY